MNAKDVANVVLMRSKTVLIERQGKVFKVFARRAKALPYCVLRSKANLRYCIYTVDTNVMLGYISDLEKGEKILYKEYYDMWHKYKIKILEVIE